MELNDLLKKLDKITFTECDEFELIAGDCWRVKIDFTFDNAMNTTNPINVVLNIYYNNNRAAFWGCINRDDIDILRLWFLRKKESINDAIYNLKKSETKIAQSAFDRL